MGPATIYSREQREQNALANAEDDVRDFNNSEGAEASKVSIAPERAQNGSGVYFYIRRDGKLVSQSASAEVAIDIAKGLLD